MTRDYTVGQHVFAANCELHGRPWDIGSYAELADTLEEAREFASCWYSDLSDREKTSAVGHINEYEVVSVGEDGPDIKFVRSHAATPELSC